MNWYVILCGIVVCIVSIAAILYYHGGNYSTLTNSNIGYVYNFEYQQPLTGKYDRYCAKVIAIRKLSTEERNNLNYYSDYRIFDKNFIRTPTLITCEMKNGNIRSFYGERTKYCRRSIIGEYLYST
jgi:hypothetical protein